MPRITKRSKKTEKIWVWKRKETQSQTNIHKKERKKERMEAAKWGLPGGGSHIRVVCYYFGDDDVIDLDGASTKRGGVSSVPVHITI